MNAVIRAISGPLRGVIFRLGHEEVTIGRQASNHLCIEDVSVSRHHCVILYDNDRYKIKDLNSHNRTLLNGRTIAEASLSNADQLKIGATVFQFVEDATNPPDLAVSISGQETVASSRIEAVSADGDRSDELIALVKIGKLLNSTHKFDEIGAGIVNVLCAHTAAESAALFLVRQGEWLAFGWSEHEGRCDAVFAKRDIINQAFKQRISIRTLVPPANPVLVLPLAIRGVIGGVIYLERGGALQPFTDAEVEFVAAVSNYAAVALDYSQKLEELESENRRMRDEVNLQHQMVGQSALMQKLYKRIARIAPTDATVLIRGETGTGKELAARAIHDNSPRAGRRFEAINCALLKGDLLESELFGHERGAFTGALTQKRGRLEIAHGGTVFLDEVAELPEAPQSMLLRVLQEHAFERLGGTTRIEVDIRIIAATNKNLEDALRMHKFREDLYYRLNVVSVEMPPLRDRRDDIPLLAHHFAQRMSKKNNRIVTGISTEAMAYLQAYDWPGNVREVENAIEHAIVFGSTAEIMPEDLPEAILERTPPQSTVPVINYQDAMRKAKKQIVLDALQQAKGDRSKAAKLLHIHPNNFYRLLRDLEVMSESQASRSG
ncbi:MAG: sigma 54-interacting transcriptional regulator [Acidobacteriaceae bacterium]|nr:sigma 54-interacting transcriptional regulator [Acidobacteriaceae bacterium]